MSGFEWEFGHRQRGQRNLTRNQWFANLPQWGKVAYIFVAFPAWAVIVFNVITGQSKSLSSVIGFGAFFVVTLALIFVNYRQSSSSPHG